MRKSSNGVNRLILSILIVVFGGASAIGNSNNTLSDSNEIAKSGSSVDYSTLKITELNYHPLDSINGLDTIEGKSYEFIEFRNTSTTTALDLTGLVIDSAVYYEFPINFILQPQDYFVVADKPNIFMGRYGVEASGNFEKNLSNSGEQIVVLNSSGDKIIDFTYSDDLPWPTEPDGDGNSLVSKENNPTGDPGDPTYWTSSKQIHGNPFGNNDNYVMSIDDTEDINVNIFPNPTLGEFNISINNLNNSVSIYNSNGVEVLKSDCGRELNVSFSDLNLSYGVYFVVVEYDDKVERIKVVYIP